MIFVKSFEKREIPRIQALLEKYRDKSVFVFKSRAEADGFLEVLS